MQTQCKVAANIQTKPTDLDCWHPHPPSPFIITTTQHPWSFVQDYLDELVPEVTFTHSDLLWSPAILYQFPPSTMIHSILPVQFTCLTVFLHNFSSGPLKDKWWEKTLGLQLTKIHLENGRLMEVHYLKIHTLNRFAALWILSGTTQVSWYRKKHSPTHTYRGHQSSLICFVHLLWSMASSLFNPRAWQFFSTISVQVFFRLPLGLAHSTSYSIHFCTQSLSSFHNMCPYHRNLFRCSTEIMSSNPCLSLNPLVAILS